MPECMLNLANGKPDVLCDHEFCLFWRVVDELGVAQDEWSGCAIQHFALLDGDSDIATWLISAKERVEASALRYAVDEAVGDDGSVPPLPRSSVLVEETDR